ncbi:MAG TPA: hypothetical protein VFM18_06245 [Methanosarcina sp.]|nr:hypothetical protein [Methanosarcina sp.]
MARICRTEKSDLYRSVKSASTETNDCSIVAVAAVCDVSYEAAKAALKEQGKKENKGAATSQIKAAVELLGKATKSVSIHDIINKYPLPHCNVLKGITTHHPERFNAVWKDGKKYLLFTRGHVLAVTDGVNHDWTKGRAIRLKCMYEVVDKGE